MNNLNFENGTVPEEKITEYLKGDDTELKKQKEE